MLPLFLLVTGFERNKSEIKKSVKNKIWSWSQSKKTVVKYRSSLSQMFFKVGSLKNFAIFTGKHLCWSLFLIKLQAWACNFVKKRLQRRCFPENIATSFTTTFLIEHLWWLLLKIFEDCEV